MMDIMTSNAEQLQAMALWFIQEMGHQITWIVP
jgi:hypothetical protein